MVEDKQKLVLQLGVLGVIAYFGINWLMNNPANQVGGDAGYNRSEIVSPSVAYRDIERPDYFYPSTYRKSIVK